MLFDEKQHDRAREDEVTHATNFLFSRIQELEATVLTQRMALESCRQRELQLHATIVGFQKLMASRTEDGEKDTVKLHQLSGLVDSLTSKNEVLLDDNTQLRKRLETLALCFGTTPNAVALAGSAAASPGAPSASVSSLLLRQNPRSRENSSIFAPGPEHPPLGSNNNSFATPMLLSFASAASPPLSNLATSTQLVAQLQQRNLECNGHINTLIGVLHHLLSARSAGASPAAGGLPPTAASSSLPVSVKSAIADVCSFMFDRDGTLPAFLHEYLRSSGGGGMGVRGTARSSPSSGFQSSAAASTTNNSGLLTPAKGGASGPAAIFTGHQPATVQMLLRRNDELQHKVMSLSQGVSF
jgi:hypothetical protein